MPDHEHGDLSRWHDRVDDMTLVEHLEGVHGWAVGEDVTRAQMKTKHGNRHALIEDTL